MLNGNVNFAHTSKVLFKLNFMITFEVKGQHSTSGINIVCNQMRHNDFATFCLDEV